MGKLVSEEFRVVQFRVQSLEFRVSFQFGVQSQQFGVRSYIGYRQQLSVVQLFSWRALRHCEVRSNPVNQFAVRGGILQIFFHKLGWRHDFHFRGISITIVSQVDSNECLALGLQSTLVLSWSGRITRCTFPGGMPRGVPLAWHQN